MRSLPAWQARIVAAPKHAPKKDVCISRGNCSTYREIGIDVRSYAMANMDVKRAACVGCGMCAHVCHPRGAEAGEQAGRFKAGEPIRVYAVAL